ncbi:MAG TPA: Fe3+-hydroxamate ABC transporter substrate-binding protein [Gammaproteobacteria bacterium]|nr:Fe3+-hydroxamate ABC transporter substrate-binding protein [Gammaproteobacteria bacterium]
MSVKKWLFFCLSLVISPAILAQIVVTDLAGRDVVLEQTAQRFIISEGRYLSTLAILRDKSPVEGLVGMLSPVGFSDAIFEEKLYAAFPEAKDIPLFGSQDEGSVSAEKIIDLQPDLAIFGIQDHGPGANNKELLNQLSAAGVKVVFIDFRLDPLNNTLPSLQLLGKVLGEDDNAQTYIRFYQNKMRAIRERVQRAPSRPTVFLQAHAGRLPCCIAMADGMLGPFIEFAGGTNIADKVAPGPTSQHTAEFLLIEDPDVWIGTASGTYAEFHDGGKALTNGPGVPTSMAQNSLKAYLDQPEFRALRAVRTHRAHSLWHNFYNSPMNIVALEAFAKWIHPELFSNFDPSQTRDHIYKTYFPFWVDGTYVSTLEP